MKNNIVNIKIGSRVRSFDWDHDRECYIEGVVEGFQKIDGCKRYKIRVQRKVWAGEEVREPRRCHVFPPVNGTPRLFGGLCDGVEVIR